MNESRYLRVYTCGRWSCKEDLFTDKEGKEVECPLVDSYGNIHFFVDLKERKLLEWKPEYGAMHFVFNVRHNGCYCLQNEVHEDFCCLQDFPPKGLVPCHTNWDDQMQIIEFGVKEDGSLVGWPQEWNYFDFIRGGTFYCTEEDWRWIAEQVEKKDTPEGDADIKTIPYEGQVRVTRDNEDEVRVDFKDFNLMDEYVRKVMKEPAVNEIEIYGDGSHMDFFRDPYEKEFPDCSDDLFDRIEPWLEREKVRYVRAKIVPQKLQLTRTDVAEIMGVSEEYIMEETEDDEKYRDEFPYFELFGPGIMPMGVQRDKYESEVPGLDLQYSFSSQTDDIWEKAFHREIHCDIYQDENKNYYGNCLGRPGERKKIGEAKIQIFDWQRCAKYIGISNIGGLDRNNSQCVVHEFIDTNGQVRDKWKEELELCDSKNILYIPHLELNPEYIGRQRGKYVLKSIMETFSGMFGIMVIYVCATDKKFLVPGYKEKVFEGSEFESDVTWKEDKDATIKLMKYYMSLGFKTCGNPFKLPHDIDGLMWINSGRENPEMEKVDIHVYWDY